MVEIANEEELKHAVHRIFKLSQTDPEFRMLCLSDPNEAVRRLTGKAVPPHMKIEFLDSPSDRPEKAGDAAT
jgi:hypothetical protein